jgi:ABC-type multidrug transport system permease subunit
LPSASPTAAIWALIRRDLAQQRSYELSLVFDLLFGLLGLIVYFFISRTFRDIPSSRLGGAPTYFAFAAVGVALTLVVQSMSTTLALGLREEQLTGTLEALTSEPVPIPALAFGLAGFPLLFAAVRTAIYLVVSYLAFGVDLSKADWVGFVVVLLAASFALLAVGVVLCALVIVVRRGAVALVSLLTFALGVGGGAFFPTSQLPGWLAPVVEVVPTRFMFEGGRAALFRGSGWGEDAAILAGLATVFVPAALMCFSLSLVVARRNALLSSY